MGTSSYSQLHTKYLPIKYIKTLVKESAVALSLRILLFQDNFQINKIDKMFRVPFSTHNIYKILPKMQKINIYNRLYKLFETEEYLKLAKQFVYHHDLFNLACQNNLKTKKQKKENDITLFTLSFQQRESGQIKIKIFKRSSEIRNVT